MHALLIIAGILVIGGALWLINKKSKHSKVSGAATGSTESPSSKGTKQS